MGHDFTHMRRDGNGGYEQCADTAEYDDGCGEPVAFVPSTSTGLNKHVNGTTVKPGQRWRHADGSEFTIFGEHGITYALHYSRNRHGNESYDLVELAYIDNCELQDDV